MVRTDLKKTTASTTAGAAVKYDSGVKYSSGYYYDRWYSESGDLTQGERPDLKVEGKKGIITTKEDTPKVKVYGK